MNDRDSTKALCIPYCTLNGIIALSIWLHLENELNCHLITAFVSGGSISAQVLHRLIDATKDQVNFSKSVYMMYQ